MNITQTQTGWLAKEENNNLSYTTFLNQNHHTIKHIVKKNKKVTEVYTLTLNTNYLHFSQWNHYSLKKNTTIEHLYHHNHKHLVWAIRTLRNQTFEKKEYYNIHEELLGIPNLEGEINYSSPLAQALYHNPGTNNLYKLLNIHYKHRWEYWKNLEEIYLCPWKNKYKIFQNIQTKYGRYINLFDCPNQFVNTIQDIKSTLIENYYNQKLGKIPKQLKTISEINKYLESQLIQNERLIPENLQKITSLLGNPVRKKKKDNNVILYTNNIQIKITPLFPFPVLSLISKTTSETEILICEELKMRSWNYIPSKLKKYNP